MKYKNWVARQVVDERSRETKLLIEGPRNLGGRFMAIEKLDLMEKPSALLKVLKAKGAHFVGTTDQQKALVEKVIDKAADETSILAMKPGWRDGGFVLGKELIGEVKDKFHWVHAHDGPDIGDRAGTWVDWTREVAEVAAKSSFLAMGLMAALGATLPEYIRQKVRKGTKGLRPLLMESAVLNFSGSSGTGKSTVGRAAASVFGSPDAISKWDFTRRGLEELCEARNDLVLILDDTEKLVELDMSLKTAMRLVGQVVPSGQSKAIAGVARQKDLPMLHWAVFGISSSPYPLDQMASKGGWSRTLGEKVRFLDIPVPGSDCAGIFDRLEGKDAARVEEGKVLIAKLEAGVAKNHGHLMTKWIESLLRKDMSVIAQQYCDHFVQRMAENGTGFDERFARKFGVHYAAGRIAVEAGLLPWEKDLPIQAASRCYRRALPSVTPEDVQASKLIGKLASLSNSKIRFPKTAGANTVIFGSKTLGVRTMLNGKRICAVRDETLTTFAGSPALAKEMVFQLNQAGVIGAGHGSARTAQLATPIEVGGRLITKPRFWILKAKKLSRHQDH